MDIKASSCVIQATFMSVRYFERDIRSHSPLVANRRGRDLWITQLIQLMRIWLYLYGDKGRCQFLSGRVKRDVGDGGQDQPAAMSSSRTLGSRSRRSRTRMRPKIGTMSTMALRDGLSDAGGGSGRACRGPGWPRWRRSPIVKGWGEEMGCGG